MEDYELSTRMETPRSLATEDGFTQTIDEYTSAIPSSGYLGVAIGAMGLSMICQGHRQRQMG
ncbi:MAG: hypothetical protein GEU77_20005 [Deltaproteobacteria bacterium]|nr:hypothetical protein [Deltaproteobacteria bacterium]